MVGGDFPENGVKSKTQLTFVARKAKINASALTKGDGGKVLVRSDEKTDFSGDIRATGGVNGGDGGHAEVTGRQDLKFQGKVDVNATAGRKGSLLLKSLDILITSEKNFTVSEQALESLSGKADIILEATNNISVRDLADDILALQASTGQ